MSKTVFVIVGPTSSGKTSLAIELCKQINGEIVSADSRQIYKYMDIGTGKQPVGSTSTIQKADTKWILNDTNIWGYDLAEPDKRFSSFDYAHFALTKLKQLREQGKQAFLVGGTGFYIDTVTGRMPVSNIEPNQNLRNTLQNLTTLELFAKLTSLNPKRAKVIDKDNKIRLIRAIEIETADFKNPTPLPYLTDTNYVYIGLTAERAVLYARVDAWLDAIWANGLLNEVTTLIKLGYQRSAPLFGLVYKSVLSYMSDELSQEDAKTRAKFDLHAYIRRQQTWFKRNTKIAWLDINQKNLSQAAKNLVESKLDG